MAFTAENIDGVSMIWHSVMRVHQGHTKLPVRLPGNRHFAEVSGMHHTQDIQRKCPRKRF